MHELSFAETILRLVEKTARAHGGGRVARVSLRVGTMSGVNKGSLTFCIEAIAAGTALAGARIEVIDVEPGLVCRECGRSPLSGASAPVCPKCGRPAEVAPATDLYVEEIELNDDEEDPAREKD
jgi:hydrogenase nickel incorporation protein HypA/HybF